MRILRGMEVSSEAGRVEADAAVMDGRDLSYGGVAAIPDLGNAVLLADGSSTFATLSIAGQSWRVGRAGG